MSESQETGRRRTRPATHDLRAAWERNAESWIAWARRPGEDSYWRFHRDVFLELVPEPAGRTLDLGCGEGRFARDLAALGHDVAAVDGSPTMVAAAREAAPAMEIHLADAAALPFADASFGLVLAFMSLQDVDDLEGTLAEASRVLRPGGRLCLAVVHPLNSAGMFASGDPSSPFVIEGSYLETSFYVDELRRDDLALRFDSVHRPLEAYVDALADAGFLLERLREPAVPEGAYANERARRWQRLPLFLHVRALKPA